MKAAMKAAILVKQNSPLEVADIDLPLLDVGQVLVKVQHSGVCGKQPSMPPLDVGLSQARSLPNWS